MLHYEMELKGGYLLSKKDDSISPLSSIQKETLWNGNFSHLLQSLHISLSKRTELWYFLCTFRSHLVP